MLNQKCCDVINWDTPTPNCNDDAVTILDKILEDEQDNQHDNKIVIAPDVLSGLRDGG